MVLTPILKNPPTPDVPSTASWLALNGACILPKNSLDSGREYEIVGLSLKPASTDAEEGPPLVADAPAPTLTP